jgi:hypothetical protein
VKTFLHRVALGVAVIGLAGCNSLSGDAIDTMRLAISGPASEISVERVNAVNGPVLLAEMGVAEAMLVSPGTGTGLAEWHGVTEMLLTHEGRIIKTAGLLTDVTVPLLAVDDPFVIGLHVIPDGLEVARLVDYPALHQSGLRQFARYQRGEVERITYMGAKHSLLRVNETIRMPELGFKATNQYWVEPDTGLVRHSVQHIAPDLPPLRLTLVKTQGSLQP